MLIMLGLLLLLLFIFLSFTILGWWRLFRAAKLEKNWKPELSQTVSSSREGDLITIHNIRTTHYDANFEPAEVIWQTRNYDLRKLKRLWFLVEPFHPTIKAIAHTFLSFEFEDDYLAVSVEARTEVGQNYDIMRGLFSHFELYYVYGDERDVILRRSNYMQRDVYMYPLITPPEEARALFLAMLERANTLNTQPQFYHSVTENCTSALRHHANQARKGSFPPFMMAQILPGLTDKVLYDKGWIATDLPFAALRERFTIAEAARAIGDDPHFSEKIRTFLYENNKIKDVFEASHAERTA